jgi:hypothetical protein
MRDGPARGGTRGGKDQFNWDDVKSDKDREYYLGHSVKASVGRWQKGKDLLWYTRGKEGEDAAAAARAEIAAVKAAEERAMAEALGLEPKAEETKRGLDAREMDALLRRRGRGDEDDGMRTRGIGVGVPGTSGGGGVEREVMAGVGIDAAREPGGSDPKSLSRRDAERLIEKARRRQKKDAKKEAKRLKKDAKKARKDDRRRRDREHRRESRDDGRSRPTDDRGRERGRSRSRSRSRSRDSRSSDSDSESRSR